MLSALDLCSRHLVHKLCSKTLAGELGCVDTDVPCIPSVPLDTAWLPFSASAKLN